LIGSFANNRIEFILSIMETRYESAPNLRPAPPEAVDPFPAFPHQPDHLTSQLVRQTPGSRERGSRGDCQGAAGEQVLPNPVYTCLTLSVSAAQCTPPPPPAPWPGRDVEDGFLSVSRASSRLGGFSRLLGQARGPEAATMFIAWRPSSPLLFAFL
jgi:hypothetical protein